MISADDNDRLVGIAAKLLRLAFCLPAIALSGCRETVAPVELSGKTMGTSYRVAFVSADEVDAVALQKQIDAELERINDQMSTYRPDSEISRFNKHSGDDWFAVSAEFAEVAGRARAFSEKSNGAFDVTVGPLVNRWSFGPNKENPSVPTEEEIAALKQSIGFDLVTVRDDPPALKKQQPGVEVDLSAIAKGYGVDRVAQLLEARGLNAYLVEIGGEIRARGVKADRTAWTVGIEKPVVGRRALQRMLPLRDAAMATSGDYRNFIEIDGRRYSHTIDPRTGRPVQHTLASVTVIADDCLSADAWATALSVLGPEEGYALAEREGLAVLLIERRGDQFVEKATPRFDQITVREKKSSLPILVVALAVFALAIVGMAIGAMFGRRCLRGSCGGLAGRTDEQGRTACDVCSNPSPSCRGEGTSDEDAPEETEPAQSQPT